MARVSCLETSDAKLLARLSIGLGVQPSAPPRPALAVAVRALEWREPR